MTPAEQGFLLLTSSLGDPERKPLSVAQFRTLSHRVRQGKRSEGDRVLSQQDLQALGYDALTALRILRLMEDRQRLEAYLRLGRRQACEPVSRISKAYPAAVRRKLGQDAPGCLWTKGPQEILEMPMVSLVGSRELHRENRKFAQAVGREAARQGYALVSGNARGADRAAQEACLYWGGNVVSVVADELCRQPEACRILYMSLDGFDSPFSAVRALSRNRVIHCLGRQTFVAQCRLEQGGTWDGTAKNLRGRWSQVLCFRDDSQGMKALRQMGAEEIGLEDLTDFDALFQWEREMQMEDFI